MKIALPENFRFSLPITVVSLALACVMIRCSVWQWERYQWKKDLVATYAANSSADAKTFPESASSKKDFETLIHKKVTVSGEYDYTKQMIVQNRRDKSGPGYWLLTPLKIANSNKVLIVSRGFIPFSDREPESWEKYSFSKTVRIEGVLQESVKHRTLLAPNSDRGRGNEKFNRIWLYPEMEKIAAQMPYPLYEQVFLQKLGGPPEGEFPAEAISIRVPPSTHFGYMIEWALLAIATLVIGFLLQVFRRKKKGGVVLSKVTDQIAEIKGHSNGHQHN